MNKYFERDKKQHNIKLTTFRDCITIIRNPLILKHQNELNKQVTDFNSQLDATLKKISDVELLIMKYNADKVRFIIHTNSIDKNYKDLKFDDVQSVTNYGNKICEYGTKIDNLIYQIKIQDYNKIKMLEVNLYKKFYELNSLYKDKELKNKLDECKQSIRFGYIDDRLKELNMLLKTYK